MKAADVFRTPVKTAFGKAIKIGALFHKRDYRYSFILAHMRSGSTLLTHILSSHKDFASAGESYVVYKTESDLDKLTVETCYRFRRLWIDAPCIVDKIVFDGFMDDEFLRSEKIGKCIIQLRSAEGSLPSMMEHFCWTEAKAVDVYVSRLKSLADHGSVLKKRAILVEYDDLVGDTEGALSALTEFFGVTPPFQPNYKLSRMTGKHVGDNSKNILEARVVRTQSHGIEISKESLAKASAAFQKCRQQLLDAGVRLAKK